MKFARWENFIFASVLTLILVGPVWGGGMPDSGAAPFTDYGYFLGELQAAGALKFYYTTEEMLRLAQFEQALMRYRFLKGHIQRKVDYRGLTDMVDLRLRFLKRQMHLQERDIAAIPPRKARIPRMKPSETKTAPKKNAAAKPKTPKTAVRVNNNAKAGRIVPGQPPAIMVIPTPPPKAAGPPVTANQKSPYVVTTTPESKEEKADDEQEKKETKRALSIWDKLKIRLNLFK